MVDILLYLESTIAPMMVGLGEKIFEIKVLRRPENANLRSVLASKVNKSFIYMLLVQNITVVQNLCNS